MYECLDSQGLYVWGEKTGPPQVSHGVSHQVYTTDQCTDLSGPICEPMQLHDSKDKQTLRMCKKKLLDCCWAYQWFNSYNVAKHFIKLLESMLNRQQRRWFPSSHLSFMLLPSAKWLKRSSRRKSNLLFSATCLAHYPSEIRNGHFLGNNGNGDIRPNPIKTTCVYSKQYTVYTVHDVLSELDIVM